MLDTDKPFSRKSSSASCSSFMGVLGYFFWLSPRGRRLVCIWVPDNVKKVSLLTAESHSGLQETHSLRGTWELRTTKIAGMASFIFISHHSGTGCLTV